MEGYKVEILAGDYELCSRDSVGFMFEKSSDLLNFVETVLETVDQPAEIRIKTYDEV